MKSITAAISGSTRVAAVIGDPISHSLSPVIHNAAFGHLGLDWVFVALRVPAGSAAVALAGAREMGIQGLSVTTPHKEAVAQLVDTASDAAKALDAVNTVVFKDGKAHGENTDGLGLLGALRTEFGIQPSGRKCAVLGAGGAARAIVLALGEADADEIIVVNRTRKRAEAAAMLAPKIARAGSPEDVPDCEIVINATTVGMASFVEGSPLPKGSFRRGQFVMDIVMSPPVTKLMTDAASTGATVTGGAAMLVHQAAHAFRIWTGTDAPIDIMLKAVSGRGSE